MEREMGYRMGEDSFPQLRDFGMVSGVIGGVREMTCED
jgi:hypothetical protein